MASRPAVASSMLSTASIGGAPVLPSFGAHSDRKMSAMPDLRLHAYKGAYAKLMGFLGECRDNGCERLLEDSYLELAQAVDSLSQSETTMESLNKHFQGLEQQQQVLGTMGIHLEDEVGPMSSSGSKATSEAARSPRRHSIPTAFDTAQVAEMIIRELQATPLNGHVESDVLSLTHALTKPVDYVSKYKMKVEKLAGWMLAIAEQYLVVPYHNWQHAMDVFFFSYHIVVQGQADKFFNFQDILALLVAAIAHDVGHFGVTNNFLVTTRAEVATIYNDESVLENMHTSKCFATMRRPGLEFMDGITTKDYNTFRGKVIGAILATDMAHHFDLVDRLSERVKRLEANPFTTDTKHPNEPGVIERRKASKSDRRMLLQACLHMADFGKSFSQWQYHVGSVARLEEEFFAQGDRERELGIPISPMYDRNKDSLAICQGTFLPKVVLPLFEPVSRMFCEEVAHTLVVNLQDNQRRWKELTDQHGHVTASRLYILQQP